MDTIIRNVKNEDFKIVEEVAREAFWNLYFPGCEEHFVIHKMQNHCDYLPELSFVIEINGKIIGSIFYTKSSVVDKDNNEHSTITFGPVSILPKYHRQGLGRKLITHSINKAKELGYKGILTLGYPYHYEPYGFKGGKIFNISMEDGKFYKGLLVLPLYENSLENISGYAKFSDVFAIDNEELENFDKIFKFKEKKIQNSQKEFQIACSMIDE